jgi:hypothetical protein
MQLQILNEKHDKLLREECGITLDEFKKLSFSQMDKMVDDTLLWIECDAESPNRNAASEVIDSVYGPYDPAEVNGDTDD